jgi:hypothetical protein
VRSRGAAIFVILVTLGCTPPQGPQQISNSGAGAYEASLAVLPNGFAACWYDTRDGNPEIYVRLLDATGKPRSSEHRLTNDKELSYVPDIVAAAGNLAVGWYDKADNGTLRARLGVWTTDGEPRWIKTISAEGHNGRNTVVRAKDNELFAAWTEDSGGDAAEVWAGWWDLNGQPVSAPQRLAPAGKTTWNLNATIDSAGEGWVVFDAKAGTQNDELFLVRVGKEKSEPIRLTTDDGVASKYPDLAFSGDRAALTWFDERDGNQEVYLFVAPSAELHEGLEQRALRITNTPGESIGAYLAWNGQRLGLAWNDNTEGQHEIYFQSFDRDGKALAQPQRVTRNETDSLIPAIKPSGNGFALAWNEYVPEAGGSHAGGRSEIAFALVK